VWEATIEGRKLNFHLAGINNQNFIMRDEETGTWWQQVSGEAILGPLKGQRLNLVSHDEIAFSIFKSEQPGGRVLMPDERVANKYAPADWEERVGKMPVVTPADASDAVPPRELVIGLRINNVSKAYPLAKLERQSPVMDIVGDTPILIVVGEDKKSVRVFERVIDGRQLEFFAKADAARLQLIDSETGSEWDFSGRATSGPLAGREVKKVAIIKDYWFDWKAYNPDTLVY
jgi:Protein of unknown function (DUF3179)